MSDRKDDLDVIEHLELLLSRCAFNASEVLKFCEIDGEHNRLSIMLKQFVETIWKDTKEFAVCSTSRWCFVSEYDGVESTFTELPEEDPKIWNPNRE